MRRLLALAALALVAAACNPSGPPESTTSTSDSTTSTTETSSTTTPPTTTTTSTVPPGPEPLDPSGRLIPPTDYPIPPGAVFMAPDGNDANPGTQAQPVRSIRRAVDLAPAGGTVILRGGTHRTWYSNSSGTGYAGVNKSLTIQGYPGEQAWFDGTDVVTNWVDNGATWSTPWSTPTFCDGRYYDHPPTDPVRGPCQYEDGSLDPDWPMAGDPQQVFVDGQPLRQVASHTQITESTFWYDWDARRLYIGIDPDRHTVELSARPLALILGNNQTFTVRGVGFRRYASNQYSNLTGAALYLGADKATIEHVVFSQNAGGGLAWANPRNDSRVTRSVFADNGYIGMGANGSASVDSGLVLEGNLFVRNNAERFGKGCVAACGSANVKLARMVDFTVRGNLFADAYGPQGYGFWCDIDCRDAVIVNNVVRGNGAAGIFYEISSRGLIAGNVVEDNGAQAILVGSATTRVWNNTVRTDRSTEPRAQGVAVYDDPRYPPNPGIGPNTTGVEVVNNIVEGPSGGVLLIAHDGPAVNGTQVEEFFDRLDWNAYRHAGSNVVNWRNGNPSIGSYYSSVAAFRAATGWEQNAVEAVGLGGPDLASLPGAPVPADIAAVIGVDTGATLRGAPG